MKASAKDLKIFTKELLEWVNCGEEVIIKYRGEPYAKLVPILDEKKSSESEAPHLFGIWKDKSELQNSGVEKYLKKLRKGRR